MTHATLGFIGAGHMSRAIINGLIQSDDRAFLPNSLLVSCQQKETAEQINKDFHVRCDTNNTYLIEHSDYLVLAVKPQQMHDVLLELAEYDLSGHVIITIAAGICIADYRKILGDAPIIIRAMPNMAAAYQAALTGIYVDGKLNEEEEVIIEAIFSAIGSTAWLDDETQVDGITALSGSGIAYFFRLMQSMREAGERYGFEGDELYDIISLTALGAATLTLESEETSNFNDWINKIAVSGGTTEAAIEQFNLQNIDAMTADAMQAVIERSKAISENLTKDW